MDSNHSINRTYTGAGTPALVISLIMSVVAFLVIIIGNGLTLVSIWRTRCLQTIPNMYISSLAVADLLMGLLVVLNILLTVEVSEELHYNKDLCITALVLGLAVVGVSVSTMVMIAVDRYIYIVHPLSYLEMITPRTARIIIITTWTASICPNLFPIFEHNWDPTIGCVLAATVPMQYISKFIGVYFATASVITCILYGAIIKTALRQNRRVAMELKRNGFSKSNWKLVKLFLVVFGVFFVSWMCIATVFILDRFWPLPAGVHYITFRLFYVNSSANFFIYACMNKDFRAAFQAIVCKTVNIHIY